MFHNRSKVAENNKGYTLVELMIALAIFAIIFLEITAFMSSSQRFYLNSSFEVSLQTEAQQVIQMLEEIMIDAQIEVSANNVDPSVSSNGLAFDPLHPDAPYTTINLGEKISVSWNKTTTYDLELVSSGSNYYGQLMLTRKDPVAGTTSSTQLFGDYVNSVSINMADYNSASRIAISVSMNNGKREYQTSKDLYLRNDLGKDSKRQPSSDSNVPTLEVLRCKEYNLNELYGSQYTKVTPSSSNSYYTITTYTSPARITIKCSTSGNNNWEKMGPWAIELSNDTGTDKKTINIESARMSIGTEYNTTNHYCAAFYNTASGQTSTFRRTYIPVIGISLEGLVRKSTNMANADYHFTGGATSFKFYRVNDANLKFETKQVNGVNVTEVSNKYEVTQEVNKILINNGFVDKNQLSSSKFNGGEVTSYPLKDDGTKGDKVYFNDPEFYISIDTRTNSIIVDAGTVTVASNADKMFKFMSDFEIENSHLDCALSFKDRTNPVYFKIYPFYLTEKDKDSIVFDDYWKIVAGNSSSGTFIHHLSN